MYVKFCKAVQLFTKPAALTMVEVNARDKPVLPHTKHIDLCHQDIESSYHVDSKVLGTGKVPLQHSVICTHILNISNFHILAKKIQ
jgi:hypothetical protein